MVNFNFNEYLSPLEASVKVFEVIKKDHLESQGTFCGRIYLFRFGKNYDV
jgi:hypothetical protein